MDHLKIKLSHQGTIKLIAGSVLCFDDLRAKIRIHFPKLDDKFTVHYKDLDEDIISVENDDDLNVATNYALNKNEGRLKLFIDEKYQDKYPNLQEEEKFEEQIVEEVIEEID